MICDKCIENIKYALDRMKLDERRIFNVEGKRIRVYLNGRSKTSTCDITHDLTELFTKFVNNEECMVQLNKHISLSVSNGLITITTKKRTMTIADKDCSFIRCGYEMGFIKEITPEFESKRSEYHSQYTIPFLLRFITFQEECYNNLPLYLTRKEMSSYC